MFGTWRALLAIAVLADHTIYAARGIGAVAVFGFFVLSGFLMTLLVCGPYKGARGAFFANRVLRLYPSYLATFAATIILVSRFPVMITWLPIDLADHWSVARQALYYVRFDDTRIVPAAFAVTNEIFCYLLIGFGISRTLPRSLIWVAGSIAVTGYIALTSEATLFTLYFPFVGALIPFALGATLFHLQPHIPRFRTLASLLLFALCGLTIIASAVWAAALISHDRYDIMGSLYVSLIPFCGMILILYRIKRTRLAPIDNIIGLMSYPIYLVQFVANALVMFAWPGITARIGEFLPALAVTLALAALMSRTIDAPINAIRDGIRNRRPIPLPQPSSSSAPTRP